MDLKYATDVELPFSEFELGTVVRVTQDWIVSVRRLIFNERLLLTRNEAGINTYEAGWCYEPGVGLIFATAWNPGVDWEPAGYKKVAISRHLW